MCGIAGLVRKNKKIEFAEIKRMTDAIAHRGPDGEGHWLRENVAIGHRRLSIIDLETGNQPMCNENETIWITYNGELYNFIELREILKQKKHTFKTHSDTEVIVHAYEQWGVDCVKRFRGMFAFAIVDTNKHQFFIARDHFGIKPLVYYHDQHCFAFASEFQALKTLNNINKELDLTALDEYLWQQYIPAPKTIYKNIKKLKPAHCMTVSFAGEILAHDEYWKLEFKPNYRKTEKDWIVELDAVIKNSVQKHLVSDVPFGAFLSGGVDSSLVVAYMSQILKQPVKTFSIGFEEKDFNETAYSQIAADKWKTDHYIEIVKPNALELLPQIVKHYGEPYGDSSAIPTYYVSKIARKQVTMVLSGDGGDEIFGGYETYIEWMKFLERRSIPIYRRAWKQKLFPVANYLFPKRYPIIDQPEFHVQNWMRFFVYFQPDVRHRLWRPEFESFQQKNIEIFDEEFNKCLKYERLAKAQYTDIKTYLPYDILTKVDVASMMNSLEVRPPLIDKEVAEFAATIPQHFKMEKGENDSWTSKKILKQVAGKYYSPEFLNRKKMGFSMPLVEWFSPNTDTFNEINSRLLNKNSKLTSYFEPSIVKEVLDSQIDYRIWLLLFLEEWLEQNQ